MSKRIIPQVAKDLRAARALIEDERDWCQECSEDEDGRICAGTAVEKVLGIVCGEIWDLQLMNRSPAALRYLDDIANAQGCINIQDLNDTFGHSAVMKAYDRAITKAIEDANR